MNKTIIKPFSEVQYKVYGYTLPEVPNHDGYIKIGDTTRNAAKRIFEQVGTVGLNPDILFEKKAQKSDGKWFRDKDLHRFLVLNGIDKKDFNGRADEWFYFNGTPEKAEELTNKFINRDYDEIQIDNDHSRYMLRNEQQQAVEKTYEYYESKQEPREFLWNAKPRFGKTLTTYDFVRNIKATNVLIVTNRPAIANSWFDDFKKFIAWQEPGMKFVSIADALQGKAMTRDQYKEFLNTTTCENPTQIVFISLQDLKGAKFAGGIHEKLEWVGGLNWDLLVIDEAHEGVDTDKTDRAFDRIKRNFTLHLSGTPFKALANNKFSEDQIFNWSYIDEQEAKQKWDDAIGSNPYESLPTLSLFTYQMSKMVVDQISEGLTLENSQNVDFAFDLNEFFKVKENGNFEYEDSVSRFLDNLSSGKFPFATDQYRNELNHTFWLLPRVKAAKALEKLLRKHPVFKDYKVILAAGDGISLSDSLEEEALNFRGNEKSFDKVKKAIKENGKTITLSVGQLTTGVTIPEWTAVLMLNNIKSPSLYFQAAFRSQNPYEFEKDGKLYRKENAYIFDFSPDRTLTLYDEFANNLSNEGLKTTDERKQKVKKLLNFFPVIAEDEDGRMHELDANEVLTIPTRITSTEVVKRGFMSNLLFANIAGIFSGDSPFKEILDKIKPEKNKRLGDRREINVNDPMLNDDGEVEIPEKVVIGEATTLFGDKIYSIVEDTTEIISSYNTPEDENKLILKDFTNNITNSLEEGFLRLRDRFELNKGQTKKVQDHVKNTVEEIVEKNTQDLQAQMIDLTSSFEEKLKEVQDTNNEDKIQEVQKEYIQKRDETEYTFKDNINKEIKATVETVVEEQIEKQEEKKKKTTEDDVRDHLRGFARTIPAFLMAYGDDKTKLANFDENIDEPTFEELTSITIMEFKKLRDGFEYEDDSGETKTVRGLFNEIVFNASIEEFFNTKKRLADYFDDSLEEDIFDYIPPQKTNQIFTPRRTVKAMVETLEEENPGIFSDKSKKFADLYVKSGLYITEIVKKLNDGLMDQIPDRNERIKWILENQVYACASSNIIYNIVKNFIYGGMIDVSTENLIECDTMKLASEGNLTTEIYKSFGDDKLKFDVIIGNPPYQENDNGKRDKDAGKNASASPLYNKFVLASMNISSIQSFIIPTRWAFGAGKGLKHFSEVMLNDNHIQNFVYYQNSKEVFPDNEIKGGVSYFSRNEEYTGEANITIHTENGEKIKRKDFLNTANSGTLIVYNELGAIVKKIKSFEKHDFEPVSKIISSLKPYGLRTDFFRDPQKYGITRATNEKQSSDDMKVYGLGEGQKRIHKFISRDEHLIKGHDSIDTWKVFSPYAYGNGSFGESIPNPFIGEPGDIVTETFLRFGNFDNELEAESLLKYIKTKFFRVLVSILKVTQHSTTTYGYVPLQDFSENSDIDWAQSIREIDKQLYEKYKLNDEEILFIEENVTEMN
ncbi:MAG: Eco57I restriction-modification methylase domain-containing protein [Carnobacterium sp.]|nr:Eco57I restriction-modification methylase domain-containing protein [Carnobacterium sp.]